MQYNKIKNNATIIKQKANQCNKTKQWNKNAMQLNKKKKIKQTMQCNKIK